MTNLESGSWRRIVELFEQVGSLPEEEREAFFADCGEPPDIVSEARELLASDAAATEGFLSPPARLGGAPEDDVSGAVDRLDRLGPYRLVKELGRGGMGTVYLGERADGQFDDRVAVKLLHGIQTPEQRRRFLVERQILASLRHPHIAYLLDGGLGEEDRPYLVMELVDGVPIDRYCRIHALSVGDRLRLFLQVASAVEHAHRNLVVHRDLKPSNVMVVHDAQSRAQVKLLDFGIAKLLDPGDLTLTRTGHRMMTPTYASPEQVRGEVVTTASDVYQLGFLLYELLTGRRPYRASSSAPFLLVQAILESDPEVPSRAASRSGKSRPGSPEPEAPAGEAEPAPDFGALPRSERFDLDAILLTTLSKDPDRRYTSVRELADDVERYLEGRPVEARGDGRAYRFGKWVRRNKAATVAAVASLLLVVSVTVLGILALVQSQQLEAERDRAESEARKANLVADYLADVFAGANPELHDGDEPTARDLLDLGASRIDQLDAPEARLQLTGIMARAFSALGDQERAQELALERLDLARTGGDPAEIADALEELATIGQFTGQFDEALRWLSEAEAIREASAEEDPLPLANSLRLRGALEREQGRWTESETTLGRSLEIYSEVAQATGDADARRGRARALSVLAGSLQFLGRLDEAVAAQREALDIYEEVDAGSKALLLDSRHTLALLLSGQGSNEEAEEMMVRVIADTRDVYGGEHSNLATALSNQGVVLYRAGRPDEALQVFDQALEMRRRLLPADHPDLASSLQSMGVLAVNTGKPELAETYLREALELRRAALAEDHPLLGSTTLALADTLWTLKRPEDALLLYRKALSIFEESLPPDSPRIAKAQAGVDRSLEPLDDE